MRENSFDGDTWPIGRPDIEAAERALGVTFPDDFTNFYLSQNGGLPERCFFVQDNGISVWLDSMIPIEPIDKEIETGMKATFRRMVDKGLLPKESIPFGRDPGGNFFLIVPADERVWYMPMDEWHEDESAEQNWHRSSRTLAYGFAAFMDALTDEEY